MKQGLLSVLMCLFIFCNAQEKLPCVESNRWKYEDYTQKPLFLNQIFSKGFGVYFIVEAKHKQKISNLDSMKKIILNAYKMALTNWGVSLLLVKDSLTDSLKDYLHDYSFQTEGVSVYNPPQVFEVDCPENANFVIRVYFKKTGGFPDSKSVLAKAQIQGRTVLLNFKDYKMVYDQHLFDVRDNKSSINLVPLLAHELGHCFGLTHRSAGQTTIMAATLVAMSAFPSKSDGLTFAKILSKQISGTKAGFFSPTECQGLNIQ